MKCCGTTTSTLRAAAQYASSGKGIELFGIRAGQRECPFRTLHLADAELPGCHDCFANPNSSFPTLYLCADEIAHAMPTAIHATQSELYKAPPGHLLLQLASLRTAAFICEADPRASFYLYIPSSHPISRKAQGEDTDSSGTKAFPLVVLAHGSGRDAEQLRNRWSDEAEKEGFVVLAPLFPCDMKVRSCHDYSVLTISSQMGRTTTRRSLGNQLRG